MPTEQETQQFWILHDRISDSLRGMGIPWGARTEGAFWNVDYDRTLDEPAPTGIGLHFPEGTPENIMDDAVLVLQGDLILKGSCPRHGTTTVGDMLVESHHVLTPTNLRRFVTRTLPFTGSWLSAV